MDWITEHYSDIFEILGYIVAAGTIVAKLTPNSWDDNFFAKLASYFSLGTAKKDESK